jgi:hypothetical protein
VTTAVDLTSAAELRAARRVASVASGLLMLLDQHRLTGRLPWDVQVQAARLRHAVKLVVQATAANSPAVARLSRPAAPTDTDPAGLLRDGSLRSRGRSLARPAGCICCASATRPPASTDRFGATAVVASTPATTGAGPPTWSAGSSTSTAIPTGRAPAAGQGCPRCGPDLRAGLGRVPGHTGP